MSSELLHTYELLSKIIRLISGYKFTCMKLALIMINKKFNNVICKRISTLRKEHKGGLSEIERNMKEPRAYTILRICSGLGITMKDFFDYNEIDDFINSIS